MGYQGAGGYGGISTMNQDQRKGRYHPHYNVTRHENFSTNETQVVCLSCGMRWYHPRGEIDNVPSVCFRERAVTEDSEPSA